MIILSVPDIPKIEFIRIQGGEFLMGDDAGKFDDEGPVHRVQLSSFFMTPVPVKQELWQAVMGDNPAHFKTTNRRPVENVSWQAVQEFLKRINSREDVQEFTSHHGGPGQIFRLPTEAEWEYAARDGNFNKGERYSGNNILDFVGWYSGNSGNRTYDVGLMLANELGMRDMSGNVWEWCSDWYSKDYYAECIRQGVVVNPAGPIKGRRRVIRGGSYFNSPQYCRSVCRHSCQPYLYCRTIGFRIVLGEKDRSMVESNKKYQY